MRWLFSDSATMYRPAAAPEKSKPTVSPYNLKSGVAESSSRFEIRLFYVRISPCASDAVPSLLVLSHLRREPGVTLEINGSRIAASDNTCTPLRRDRIDSGVGEVTYVSTDCVRLSGAVNFEVFDGDRNLILCGSLERIEAPWSNGSIGFDGFGMDKDSKTGWSMSCYSAVSIASSAFVQPKLGMSSPSIEVYVAGSSGGFPLILTQEIQHSPRKKAAKPSALHAILEDEETSEALEGCSEFLISRRISSLDTDEAKDVYKYNTEIKEERTKGYFLEDGWYPEAEDQLSWFNAGVRVGMGIGLGVCVGIGIGTGLLLRSYQASSRNFMRRFF